MAVSMAAAASSVLMILVGLPPDSFPGTPLVPSPPPDSRQSLLERAVKLLKKEKKAKKAKKEKARSKKGRGRDKGSTKVSKSGRLDGSGSPEGSGSDVSADESARKRAKHKHKGRKD